LATDSQDFLFVATFGWFGNCVLAVDYPNRSMAIGQCKVPAPQTYGIANGAAVPTSPDRGK
jgi:hypothetical protein